MAPPVLNVEAQGVPSRSAVLVVTRDYYQVFPIRPVLGRLLQGSDWRSNAENVNSVLSSAPNIGSNGFIVTLACLANSFASRGGPYTVIGVLPVRFSSPQIDVTPVVTVPFESVSSVSQTNGTFNPLTARLLCYGRLRHGVSLERARARLATLCVESRCDAVV